MLTKIQSHINRSQVYAESTSSMWNDKHIANQMLGAHLNPAIDSASRNHDFITESAEWIHSKIKPSSKILDLGCGPGLYATKFSQKGHDVTGLDISESSIEYAINTASKNGLNIKYECKNYLEIDDQNKFDVVLLIYCDFGVLAFENQKLLLRKTNKCLKETGVLIFDMLTHEHFLNYQESKSWRFEESGFWRPNRHLILEEKVKYQEETVILEKYQIIEEDRIECYQNWNKCFEKNEITTLLKDHGFSTTGIYSDVAGKTYDHGSDTIAIIATKQ